MNSDIKKTLPLLKQQIKILKSKKKYSKEEDSTDLFKNIIDLLLILKKLINKI
mgnify:CR=1 FL=1